MKRYILIRWKSHECLKSAIKYVIIGNDNKVGLNMYSTIGHQEGKKYLDRKYLEVTDAVVQDRKIRLINIKCEFNPADMLTKSLKSILEKRTSSDKSMNTRDISHFKRACQSNRRMEQ